ncbi:hypothetical protein [Variovorax rhizosphaerae]|uniref:Uncharacterized protein n=1 Tax=Variovorax rhizosphaerae TaxID=1836200 RepID=A0ABU8WLP5_9BURK
MATPPKLTPGTITALALDFRAASELAEQARLDTARASAGRRAARQDRRYARRELALVCDALRAGQRLFAALAAGRRRRA